MLNADHDDGDARHPSPAPPPRPPWLDPDLPPRLGPADYGHYQSNPAPPSPPPPTPQDLAPPPLPWLDPTLAERDRPPPPPGLELQPLQPPQPPTSSWESIARLPAKDKQDALIQALRSSQKDDWKAKVNNLLDFATSSLVEEVRVAILLAAAPIFAPWFTDESSRLSRRLWGITGESWTQESARLSDAFSAGKDREWATTVHQPRANREHSIISASSLRFSRQQLISRNDMGQNVSDAREGASFWECRTWATQRLWDAFVARGLNTSSLTKPKGSKRDTGKRKMEDGEGSSDSKKVRKLSYDADSKAAFERRAAKDKKRAPPKRKEPECLRALRLRLYPSAELGAKLREWESLAASLRQMVRARLQKAKDVGEKTDAFVLADQTCLSQTKWNKMTAEERASVDQNRQRLIELPHNFQRELVLKVAANARAAQTNLERGSTKSYRLDSADEDDKSVLFFTSEAIDKRGALFPRILKHIDSNLYVRDRMLAGPGERRRKRSDWVKLLTGASRSFSIHRTGRKWYLLLSHDAWTGPYTEEGKRQGLDKRWNSRNKAVFEPTKRAGNCIALDPGARDLLTGYDAQRQQFYTYLTGFNEHIERAHASIASAQSKLDKLKNETGPTVDTDTGRRRRRARRRVNKQRGGKKKKGRSSSAEQRAARKAAKKSHPHFVRPNERSILRAHERLRVHITQAQNCTVNALVSNYDLVVLPDFMTARMIKRRRRRQGMPYSNVPQREAAVQGDEANEEPAAKFVLAKRSRATLARFGHRQFRERLVAKAQADPNHQKDVLVTSEEYTTKQHPFQRGLHSKIGGSKTWHYCHLRGKRDNVGAFNILLRALTKDEVRLSSQ
ncbi:unnamed protein product [Tilletia controversa]|nr:unnamed protein product [Tilletia controversa]